MSGEELCKKAHSKEKGMLFGIGADFDAAQELYTKAGAQYKLKGDYLRAAEAYTKAAECAVKIKNPFQVAEDYNEAAMMFLKASSPKFEATMDLAVQALIDNNRLSRAADMVTKAAEQYRSMGMLDKSLAAYQKAEKFYTADSQAMKSNKCKQVQAEIYSELQQYGKALPLYEDLAKGMLGGPLKFQAADMQVKAMLCRFAMMMPDERLMQVEECKEQLELYTQTNPYLEGSREEEVLRLLLEAIGAEDMLKFEEALLLLQQLKMLDDWKTAVLLVIRDNMQSVL
eukprot:gene11798-8109_t